MKDKIKEICHKLNREQLRRSEMYKFIGDEKQ